MAQTLRKMYHVVLTLTCLSTLEVVGIIVKYALKKVNISVLNVTEKKSCSSHKHIIVTNSDQTSSQHSPKCSHHCETSTLNAHDNDYHQFEDYDSGSEFDISDTLNTSQFFQEASMVMTLAERFNLTRFREYQKDAILALLSGRDCHPTGNGKSLCFTFPAVYENKKKTIVVTPTISLMMDQVKNCGEQGIKAAYLGSAQLDLSIEDQVLSSTSDANMIFVTPEWDR